MPNIIEVLEIIARINLTNYSNLIFMNGVHYYDSVIFSGFLHHSITEVCEVCSPNVALSFRKVTKKQVIADFTRFKNPPNLGVLCGFCGLL